MTETHTVRSTLYKTRNIRHYKALLRTHGDNAENGYYSCEMIIAYNGLRLTHHRQKRGFTYIRKTDKTNVGNELQFKRNIPLLARSTAFRKARSLACRGGKMRIAPSALTALRRYKRLVG